MTFIYFYVTFSKQNAEKYKRIDCYEIVNSWKVISFHRIEVDLKKALKSKKAIEKEEEDTFVILLLCHDGKWMMEVIA